MKRKRFAVEQITAILKQAEMGTRWSWEVQVPELETSVFIIPPEHVKNGIERYVVLNRTAKSVIEAHGVNMISSCSRPKLPGAAGILKGG